jgi:hypothetical protein
MNRVPRDRLRLPLTAKGELRADPKLHVGFSLARTERGLVVATKGSLSLFSTALTLAWSLPFTTWSDGLVSVGSALWYGASDEALSLIDLVSGAIVERVPCPPVTIRAVSGDVALCLRPGGFDAIRVGTGVVWSREVPQWGLAVAIGPDFIITEERGAVIACLEATTGKERWRRLATQVRSSNDGKAPFVISGMPSIFASAGDIVIVNSLCEIARLRAADGELIAEGRPPLTGTYDVEGDLVHFLSPGQGLSTFDSNAMCEVERQQFAFKAEAGAAHGLCVGEEAIVWTLPSGELAAVERRPQGAERQTWSMHVGGLMSIGQAPLMVGNCLYWYRMPSTRTKEPASVLCFQGGNQ